MTRIIDISMPITKRMLTYPRNPKPKIRSLFRIPADMVNQSVLTLGSHTGTHVDAAYHAFGKGWTTESRGLGAFYGNAVVVDVTQAGRLVEMRHLVGKGIAGGDVVLLKTGNSEKGYATFRRDFASLGLTGAAYLKSRKIKAVGTDYLSIERFGSDFSVHKLLLKAGIPIFEGLVLKRVPAGKYTFIGFPIKYDGDAAPLRAVLIK